MIITKSWLKKNKACKDAVARFCEVYPSGKAALNDVIDRLERADWLMWLLEHTGTPHQEMVRLARLCASRSLKYLKKGETRPLRAIGAAGDATWAVFLDAMVVEDAAWANEHRAMCEMIRGEIRRSS